MPDSSSHRGSTKLWPVLAVAFALTACTNKNDAAPPADAGGADLISCSTDVRAQVYTANMVQMGAAGTFKFVLVQADPSPPSKGTNVWSLRVTDASQNAVSGATIDVVPFMPDHGHGTSVTPVVTPAADGGYTISSLYLFMPGIWRVTINVESGAVKDSAMFFFCIEG
jgi:hypothetical protein